MSAKKPRTIVGGVEYDETGRHRAANNVAAVQDPRARARARRELTAGVEDLHRCPGCDEFFPLEDGALADHDCDPPPPSVMVVVGGSCWYADAVANVDCELRRREIARANERYREPEMDA